MNERVAEAACYVYCVCRCNTGPPPGVPGIGGAEVHPVREAGLCALVHDGPSRPFTSSNPDEVAGWVLAHHRVVEAAWRQWGAVLPMTFNTIVVAGPGSAEAQLASWMHQERDRLSQRLDALGGLAEYGVQLFCDPAVIAREVATASPEIRGHEQCTADRSGERGVEYLSRRRIERVLRQESQARVARVAAESYRRVESCVTQVRVERVRDASEAQPMAMHLTCLVSAEQHAALHEAVVSIDREEGFSARLVGPLPPYSFS